VRLASSSVAFRWSSTVFGAVLITASAQGEGFRNSPPGTFNLGRAGGRFAHVQDASAVTQNPANLMDLEDLEVLISPSVVSYSVDFSSAAGSDETESPWHVLPNVFFAAPIPNEDIAFGLAVTTPFGLGTEWAQPVTSPFRYLAPYEADLLTVNINPSLSVRLTPTLTVGAGVSVMLSEVELRQHYPWFLFPGSTGTEPDGDFRVKGDGRGFGGNVGITWEFIPGHRLAATYRSHIGIRYDGTSKIDNLTPTAIFLGATPESDFATRIEFPTIVGLGYGVEVSERVRVEVNAEFLEFSNFDQLPIDVGNNAFLLPSTEIEQDWRNTFTAGVAADWKVSGHWTVSGGYQFYQTPVPEKTLSPTIPDSNQHVATVGVAWHCGGHSVEAAYGYDYYEPREVRENQTAAFNGDYEFSVHLLSFAYRLRF
jgi:long-chain fatty acid transport protein